MSSTSSNSGKGTTGEHGHIYTRCFICYERVGSNKGRVKRKNDKSLLQQKTISVQILCELLDLSLSTDSSTTKNCQQVFLDNQFCTQCLKQLDSIRETKEKAEKYLLELVNLLSEVMGNLIESTRAVKNKIKARNGNFDSVHPADRSRNSITNEIIRQGTTNRNQRSEAEIETGTAGVGAMSHNNSLESESEEPKPNTEILISKFHSLIRVAAHELLELNGFELISSHSHSEGEDEDMDLSAPVAEVDLTGTGTTTACITREPEETPRLILVQEIETESLEVEPSESEQTNINISHDSGIISDEHESTVHMHNKEQGEYDDSFLFETAGGDGEPQTQEISQEVSSDNINIDDISRSPEEDQGEQDVDVEMEEAEDEETLKCPVVGCKQKFCLKKTGDYRLRAHVERYHHGVQKCFKCSTCGQGFKEYSSLQTHENSVHFDIYPFPCEYENCNKQFRNKRQLTLHEKSYHRPHELPYACEFCGKRFMKKYNMESHRRTHTGETPYSCSICSESFKSASNLAYHRDKAHSDSSSRIKSVCNVCGKSFLSKDGLKGHMFKQHGCSSSASDDDVDKAAVVLTASICEICGYVASSSGGTELKRHILMAHTDKRPEQCNDCDKRFKTRSALLSHCRLKHTNIRPYKCEYCNRGFLEKSKLDRHQLTHTGEKKYACGYCAKKFYDGADVNRHRRRIHGVETGKKSQNLIGIIGTTGTEVEAGTSEGTMEEFVIPITEIEDVVVAPPGTTTTVITVQMNAPTANFDEQIRDNNSTMTSTTTTTTCDIETVSFVIPTTTITPTHDTSFMFTKD